METVRCISFVFLFGVVHSSDWWMEEPYRDDSFNVHGKYGDNASIKCADHRHPYSEDIQFWILPDLTVMNRTDYKDFRILNGLAGWIVSSDGTSVEAFLIQERHFGFYYCVFNNRSTGNTEVIKKGLNYKGPYFGDLWPTYEKPVIIGSTAAGICLALFTVLCFVYELKFHKEFKKDVVEAGEDDRSQSTERLNDGEAATVCLRLDIPEDSCYGSRPMNRDEGSQVTQRKTEKGAPHEGGGEPVQDCYTWM